MSRTIIARGASLAAITLLALTACGGTEDSDAEREPTGQADEQAPEQDSGADAADDEADDRADAEAGDAEAAEADAAGAEGSEAEDGAAADSDAADADTDADAPGSSTEDGAGSDQEPAAVDIGTEFTDEETGDVITVVSALRGNSTEYYAASDNPDGEMIYLEVAITPGEVYGGVVSQSDFVLDDDGDEVNYAASADDELTAAGYDYFDGAPRRDGEATGYIPIYVETTGDTLTGAYVRPEMKVLGEDTTVPEFRGEFEIPAA